MSSLHNVFINCAGEMSVLSKCISHKVACVLVKDGRIVSTGINGTPPGYKNCCDEFPLGLTDECKDRHHEWSNNHEIHAEQNAIAVAAKNGVSIEGAVAYSTLQPCRHCTKLLIAAGISKIYYSETYHRNDEVSANLLNECGIECEQVVHGADFFAKLGCEVSE